MSARAAPASAGTVDRKGTSALGLVGVAHLFEQTHVQAQKVFLPGQFVEAAGTGIRLTVNRVPEAGHTPTGVTAPGDGVLGYLP